MSENETKLDVENIINSLRNGMDDTTPLQENHPEMGTHQKLKSSLRKATASSDVLGRCGGSLRGKLCKQLARVALPVIEQINIHHGAVTEAINQINDSYTDKLEKRISDLEKEIATLKARNDS